MTNTAQIFDETEFEHRVILLSRIAEMRKAEWSDEEIASAVSAWPSDWQALAETRQAKEQA